MVPGTPDESVCEGILSFMPSHRGIAVVNLQLRRLVIAISSDWVQETSPQLAKLLKISFLIRVDSLEREITHSEDITGDHFLLLLFDKILGRGG